jgi:hypothetical protein
MRMLRGPSFPFLLKISTFRRLHNTRLAEAVSFRGGKSSNRPPVSACLQFSAFDNFFVHTFSYFPTAYSETCAGKNCEGRRVALFNPTYYKVVQI